MADGEKKSKVTKPKSTDGRVDLKGQKGTGQAAGRGNIKADISDVAAPTINVRVDAKPDETAEQLLRRFNREVIRSGIIQRLRELEFYEKPSQRRKREAREKYEQRRRRRYRES